MATCCSLFHWCPNLRICFFLLHSWLFEGLGREKAEELLQLPNTKVGSFMIRESETRKGEKKWLLFLTLEFRHYEIYSYLINFSSCFTQINLKTENVCNRKAKAPSAAHQSSPVHLYNPGTRASDGPGKFHRHQQKQTQLFKHYYLLWSHAKLIRQWVFSNGGKGTALPWSTKGCVKKL